MKNLFVRSTLAGVFLLAIHAEAATSPSPFATTTTGPLNQSFTDDINGSLVMTTNTPAAGNLASLTDAVSSTTPTSTVIVGPDNNSTTTLSWDLGMSIDPALRKLDTVSIWIADNPARLGFNGSLAISTDGLVYTQIDNSLHIVNWESAQGSYHHILYDFTGTNVTNFRYIQVASTGFLNPNDNSTTQPEFVEIDIATSSVPEPSTIALFLFGTSAAFFLKKRKS